MAEYDIQVARMAAEVLSVRLKTINERLQDLEKFWLAVLPLIEEEQEK